jgi:hypothetical protein
VRAQQAEIPVELGIRHAAQHVFVENGNLVPLGRIVETLDIDMVELAFEEASASCLRYGVALARGLDVADLLPAGGRRKRRCDAAHEDFSGIKLPIQRSWAL